MGYSCLGIKHLFYIGLIYITIGLIKAANNDEIKFQCPNGWTNINYMCYKAVNEPAAWDIARDFCKSMESELVQIPDYWTNKDVGALNVSEYWIGFSQLSVPETSDDAHWSNGDETNIQKGFWANFSPDQTKGECVYEVQTDKGPKWVLANCDHKKKFICEKQACTVDTFMCRNSRCIGKSQMCDNKDDCKDGSDEQNCPKSCQYYQTGSSGTLKSLNYPGNYEKNSFCLWKIQADFGTYVKLTFSEFVTEANTDIVEIFVGSLSESEAFFKYRLSGNNVKQKSYTSPNNLMVVKFMSDDSQEFKGFMGTWTTVSSNLKPITISADPSGNLTVDNFQNNEHNTWTIRTTQQRQIITLQKIQMHLLDKDEVVVFNGDSLDSPILATYKSTGKQSMGPEFVQSTGKAIMILLKSRGLFSGGKFSFSYHQGCLVEIENQSYGEIMSPGYDLGQNYPNSMDCKWNIHLSPNSSYLLKFDAGYNIDSPDDILYVNNIVNGKSIMLFNSTSATSSPTDQKIASGSVQFIFQSNSIVNKKGFKAVFSVDCPKPNFNADTITTPTSIKWHYGSSFDVSCKTGYSFYSEEFAANGSTTASFVSKTSVKMTCLQGGQWNVKTIPQCLKKYCGPVKPIQNGGVLNATGVMVGDMAQYTCVDGYTIGGKNNVQCEANGEWGDMPVCNATGCNSPSNITNGQVILKDGTWTSIGSIIHYKCNPGYEIVGLPISMCLKTAKWSSNAPSCKILQCSAFGLEIPNSHIKPAGDVNFMETKNVTCDSGYTLNGTSTLVCKEDRSFDTLPTCEDNDECQESSSNKCNQICINTPGSYYCKCKAGYKMKADNVTCEDINECQTQNGGCEQICNNTDGSYECSCKNGYALYTANNTMEFPLQFGDNGKSIGGVFYLNHSCVPVLCPKLENLANGYIQPQRKFSHFGDIFYFSCKIGFILKGRTDAICLQNGNWSSTLPICEAIKCSPDGNNTHPDVPYLGFFNFTCDVKGKPKEYRHRQCLYDPLTTSYKLLGDSYQCEEIDCGQPKPIAGALDFNVTKTTYGSEYEVNCSGLYRLSGNSSYGNSIRCESDGKWTYGDLRCDGVQCDFPSLLVEATVNVTGFTEGSIATYKCTKKGYSPFKTSQRKCVKNSNQTGLIWDLSTPICVDVQQPTLKNGTCNDVINLDKYSALNLTFPEFEDNSGYYTVQIEPKTAITGYIVTRNMTIVYTATDKTGNNVSCTRDIIVEDHPLQITCPPNMVEMLENLNDTKTITLTESMVNVTGPGTDHNITFTPKELILNATNIDSVQVILVETSYRQKTAKCTFTITVQAKQCSALSTPVVQHATLIQGVKFTCNENYGYPDRSLKNVMTTTCNSTWDVPYTSCSKLDSYAEIYGNLTIIYDLDSPTEACAKEIQEAVIILLNTYAETSCIFMVFPLNPYPLNSTIKTTIDGEKITVNGLLKNKKAKPMKSSSEKICLDQVHEMINNPVFKMHTYFKHINTTCGKADFNISTSDTFSRCSNTSTEVEINLYAYCVSCPPGSHYNLSNGVVKCQLCPIGEYQDQENQPTCTKCPSGKSTYSPGGYNINMCKETCPAGFFSETGLPPCKSCPMNTYSVDAINCQTCPNGTKGREIAATSKDSCKAKCKPGSFSFNGYEPCHLCAKGFYSNQEMQTECTECADKKTTKNMGEVNEKSCVDSAEVFCKPDPCVNGQCLPFGHLFICNCTSGYTGELCDKVVDACSPNPCYYGGKCSKDGASYKCNCTDGTNGQNCENIIETCKNDTCKNNGVCRNKIRATQCYCLLGYDGEYCEKVSYPCSKNPCKNGTCTNLGTSNFKCDCKRGFEGEKCDKLIDNCASSPCLFNSSCTNLVDDFSCDCIAGYGGKTCNERTDLCSNTNCNMGICVPNIQQNTNTCSCDVGYTYSDFCQFSIKTGSGNDNGTYNKSVNVSSKTCISKCSKDSQCKSVAYDENNKICYFYKTETEACCKVFTKECKKPSDNFWTPWYTVKNSIQPLKAQNLLKDIGIDVCNGLLTPVTQCKSVKDMDDKMRPDKYAMSLNLNNPCVVDDCKNPDGSVCTEYQIRFQCAVSKVMQNNQCEKKSACYDIHCDNGGQCAEITGSCACPMKYNVPLCRFEKDFCLGNPCGNGTCIGGQSKVVCQCDDGFVGVPCKNIDDCKSNPCDALGTEASGCQDLIGDYHCPCKAGYKGKNCSEAIKECLSNPCLHQGECIDGVNDFTCNCTDGWTGKRCEKLTDYCTTSTCLNNGVCLNIFKSFYCKCQPNTYGLNCSESVSLCKDANPCLNGATCSEFGGKTQCKCKQGYTGVGCEISVDFCKSEVCANGGTCLSEKNGYTCQCPSGFTGTQCEKMTNDCTTSIQTCLEPMPIDCPAGKTGSSCSKDISSDYDMNFYLSEKNGIAMMKSAVNVSGTNLSISLWVRFKELNGHGTFFNLFIIESDGIFEKKVPVLRISDVGVTYTTANGKEEKSNINTLKMNDGKWSLLTIVISDFGRSTEIRLNNIDTFDKVSVPIMNFFGKECLVILGCFYDAKLNIPVVNDGFYGELSQVDLYSTYIDFNTDIGQIISNPKARIGNILFGWENYKLGRGVYKIVPSTVNKTSTTVGQEFIEVKSCPHMVNNYGSQGRTLLKWDPPKFSEFSELKQNYRPGTIVLWGRYAVTYKAKDKNGNVGLCNFMVYAKEGNCTKPENPYEGTAHCDNQEFPYYSCNITCNQNRAVTAPAPRLFTCGPSGSWHPEKIYMPMKFPSCGKIKKTVISTTVNLQYALQSTSCDVVKKAMKPKLTETMIKLNNKNGGILCQMADCSDIKWDFKCNDRLTATQKLVVEVIVNAQNTSVFQILTEAALDQKDFDFPSLVGGGTLLYNEFSLSSDQTCGKGEALIQGRCVECTPGTYLKVSTQCDECPVGTYQPDIAQTSCKFCPVNTTTLGTGHMKSSSCKVKCPIGEFFDMGAQTCKKCDIVSYQDLEGQFSCKPCMSGKSTKQEGATSEDQCTETCPAGFEFTTNCTACLIGYYRENDTGNTCKKCSNSSTITYRTGATSEKECNVSACFAGTYLDESNNTCILCLDGQYQDDINQNSCKHCPSKWYRTGKEGATKLDDCKFFCPSGFEARNKICHSCRKGTYKDNKEDFHGFCKTCPDLTTTLTDNSTSLSDCKIYKCPAGQQPNATNNGCEPCPLGSYQPEDFQEKCIPCNANYSTRTTGSKSNTCEVFCDSGFERVAGHTSLCKECGIGYFKDNSLGLFSTCELCPNGNITEKIGSVSEQNCTKANCTAGQYLNAIQNKCFDCDYGFYQDKKWQPSCIPCPPKYTTYETKADRNTSCLLSCASGSEVINGKCQLCQIGYFRNNSNPNQKSCLICPDPEYVTEKEGAVSDQQCTTRNCTAGTYLISNNTCLECPLNEYQDAPFQKKCLRCADGFKTWRTGSTACARICPAGEENKNDICTKCPIGYFRKITTENCTKCPKEFLTKEEGAKSELDCTVPSCEVGLYYNGSDCIKCPKNTFQNEKYQKVCKTCPNGKYTKDEGTTKEADCLSYCATKADNCSQNSTCIDDPSGFKCECNRNYVQQKEKCIHMCDMNYCQNGATCSRGKVSVCVCSKYFDGPKCERQLSAKEVSKDNNHAIIGAVVGVLAGILIIILIVTYVCVRMRRKPQHNTSVVKDRSLNGTLSTKYAPTYVSIHPLASQPILDQEPNQVNAFTNSAYDEDNDPAVFKA